jgi:hypothetical protein
MLGRAPKAETSADEPPECPLELAYLWSWFIELSYGLAPGFGPAMATWDNVGWWSQLMRIALDPWEARMLVELSAMRASIVSEKPKPKPVPTNGVQGHKRRRR